VNNVHIIYSITHPKRFEHLRWCCA
jgi:hypothetical protein